MKNYCIAMLSTGAGMTVLILAYLALLPALEKRYSPRGLYGAWIALAVGLLIPFAMFASRPVMKVTLPASLSRPVMETAVTEENLDNTISLPDEAQIAQAAGRGSTSLAQAVRASGAEGGALTANAAGTAPLDWLQMLCWIWLAGAAVTLALLMLSHARFMRTVRRWRKPCEAEGYQATLRKCMTEMGVRGNVKLWLCPTVSSPMLAGFARPAILLPDTALGLDELELVLRHELTHLRRGDLLVKALMMLCYTLHWYNPAVWLMGRSLCFYQEASCDSLVTARADAEERRFYSETIIRVIRRQTRARTALCTSFYGGKNGMKRRILSIMQDAGRRTGSVLCVAAAALAVLGGSALALEAGKLSVFPQNAWVHSEETVGTVLLEAPTANDLTCPMGIYLNGTPVVVMETRESSALPEWNCVEGEPNWAFVLIGGDGERNGISGWIPLRDLAFTCTDALPAAELATQEDTGHTSLYAINDREGEVARIEPNGTAVQVLGQLRDWLHVALEDKGLFVLQRDVKLSQEADEQLYELLPDRFSDTTRREYDTGRIMDRLVEEKAQKYGDLPLEYWSVEDKAWYGQLEEQYMGSHDHYYLMPGEDDLPLEKAQAIALEAYARELGRESVAADEVDLYPGFYRLGYSEPLYWNFIICPKGGGEWIGYVTIHSPGGEVESVRADAPPEGNG